KNRFSASGGRESQGGGLLQLALARLSAAEQVSLEENRPARAAGRRDGRFPQKISANRRGTPIPCEMGQAFRPSIFSLDRNRGLHLSPMRKIRLTPMTDISVSHHA